MQAHARHALQEMAVWTCNQDDHTLYIFQSWQIFICFYSLHLHLFLQSSTHFSVVPFYYFYKSQTRLVHTYGLVMIHLSLRYYYTFISIHRELIKSCNSLKVHTYVISQVGTLMKQLLPCEQRQHYVYFILQGILAAVYVISSHK